MDSQTIAHTLRGFISENFMVEFGSEVDDDTDLFEAKYLDSFGFVDLVAFIEQRFGVKLGEDDLAEPSMGCLSGMQAMVARRMQEHGA